MTLCLLLKIAFDLHNIFIVNYTQVLIIFIVISALAIVLCLGTAFLSLAYLQAE